MDIEYVRKQDKDGNSLYFVRYLGHIFLEEFPKNVRTRLDQLQEMPIRADDVIFVEYAKSGLHWANSIVNMILSANINFTGSPVFPEHHNFKEIEAMPSPRILAFHTHYKFLPKQVKENKAKIIYIERNPKDVITSYYYFLRDLTFDMYRGSFDGLVRFFLQDEFFFDNWFNFTKWWHDSIKEHPDNRIFVLKYERLVKDTPGTIRELANFLETSLDDTFLAEIVTNTHLDILKKHHETIGEKPVTDVTSFSKSGVLPIYRKGKIGDWKNHFTVAQNEEFDKIFAEKMKGYDIKFDYE